MSLLNCLSNAHNSLRRNRICVLKRSATQNLFRLFLIGSSMRINNDYLRFLGVFFDFAIVVTLSIVQSTSDLLYLVTDPHDGIIKCGQISLNYS